jgi:segregation and condensation protein A
MPENTRDMAPDRTGLPTERRTDGAARGSWLADAVGFAESHRCKYPDALAATMTPMSYDVRTPVFEGPFDLLLHLILREQVELYEISLSGIVDAYLVELARMDTLDLEIATEFLLIAATLVELKTKRLLPDDPDLDLDDELLARLLECKTFKDAARTLEALHSLAALTVARRVGPEERFLELTPDLLEGITPERLRSAFLAAVQPRPEPRIDLVHVAAIRASVVDAVADLCRELPGTGHITFRELTASLVDRIEVIVQFLAILELYKQGLVDLLQPRTFGDIEVVWRGGESVGAAALDAVDAYDG